MRRLREFLAAPCGRIYSGTTAFAALSAALIGLAGPRAPAAAIPLVVLFCILGGIASVGLAIDRFPVAALTLLLVLPLQGALYFAGLTVIGAGAGPAPLLFLLVICLASLLAATAPSGAARGTSTAVRPRHGSPLPH